MHAAQQQCYEYERVSAGRWGRGLTPLNELEFNEIEFRETESEYLLLVPPSQMGRARQIHGFKARRALGRDWLIYSKTQRVRDSILLEFGDEIRASRAPIASSVGKEEPETDVVKAPPPDEASPPPDASGIVELVDRLTARELELQRVKADLERLQTRDSATIEHRGSRANLHESLSLLLRTLFPADADASPEVLSEVIGAIESDGNLPLRLGRRIESNLREALKTEPPPRGPSFYDLILLAESGGLLTQEGVSLAHALRTQRNLVAHGDEVDRGSAAAGLLRFSILARNLMCISAFRLLLYDLKRGRRRIR